MQILTFSKRLPRELIQACFEELSYTDVRRLQRTFPAVFETGIPDSSWSLRFEPDGELGYIFEGGKIAIEERQEKRLPPINHQRLFRAVKKLEELKYKGYGLTERRRIWGLARIVFRLMYDYDFAICAGIPLRSEYEKLSSRNDEGLLPGDDSGNWTTAERQTRGKFIMFDSGCRCLYNRLVTFGGLSHIAAVETIWVSLIKIGQLQYVSGLRFLTSDSRDIRIGYVQLNCEKRVHFPKENTGDESTEVFKISEILAAMDSAGLRGIRFVTDAGCESKWLGAYINIPKKVLRPQGNGCDVMFSLKAGMDVSVIPNVRSLWIN